MIVFACFFAEIAPPKKFLQGFCKWIDAVSQRVKPIFVKLQICRYFPKNFNIQLYVYILYFIRIFYKSAKVPLLQLIFKGLRFVKRFADVLQIDFLAFFLQLSLIALHSSADLTLDQGSGID